MKRALISAGMACLLVVGMVIAIYYVPYTNFKVLNAEIEIERAAARKKSYGEAGRDCFNVDAEGLSQSSRRLNGRPVRKHPGELTDLPVHCLAKMHLVEMRYSAQANVVSGIYRCEEKGMVQELQLAIYLEPKTMPYDDYCSVARFMESRNIPVGAATGYPW